MNDRKPGDVWKPKDPTEIEPGMIQIGAMARCAFCRAQTPVAITVSLQYVEGVSENLLAAFMSSPGPSKLAMIPEDISLPDGWGLNSKKFIVCVSCDGASDGKEEDGQESESASSEEGGTGQTKR